MKLSDKFSSAWWQRSRCWKSHQCCSSFPWTSNSYERCTSPPKVKQFLLNNSCYMFDVQINNSIYRLKVRTKLESNFRNFESPILSPSRNYSRMRCRDSSRTHKCTLKTQQNTKAVQPCSLLVMISVETVHVTESWNSELSNLGCVWKQSANLCKPLYRCCDVVHVNSLAFFLLHVTSLWLKLSKLTEV